MLTSILTIAVLFIPFYSPVKAPSVVYWRVQYTQGGVHVAEDFPTAQECQDRAKVLSTTEGVAITSSCAIGYK